MRHLNVLLDAGLISSVKRGRERWHYLNSVPLVAALREWLDPLGEQLGASLLDLKQLVEADMDKPSIDFRLEVTIAAIRREVFEAIVERPGAWWNAAYLDPRAVGLSLQPVLGGAFIEEWEDGGQVLATVTAIQPDRHLTLTGPFHLGGGHGIAELTLIEVDQGTTVALAFKAFGLLSRDIVEQFPNGWRSLITVHLKEHVETGQVVGVDKQRS